MGHNILIIEDDAESIKNYKTLLERHKYAVHSTQSLDEALSLCKKEKYDCLLLDLHLQDKSGADLVNFLRAPQNASNFNSKTPIIILSGWIDHQVIVQMSTKAQGLLVKPITGENLLNKIEAVLNGQNDLAQISKNPAAAPGIPLEKEMRRLIHDVAGLVGNLAMSMENVIELSTSLPPEQSELKDHLTFAHSQVEKLRRLISDYQATRKKAS